MENKFNSVNITLWIIFGVVFSFLFYEIIAVFSTLISIAGIFLRIDKVSSAFLDLLPFILRLVFWVYMIFFFIMKGNPNGIITEFPKKTARQITVFAIIFVILSRILTILQNYTTAYVLNSNADFKMSYFSFDEHDTIQLKTAIFLQSFLYFVEILVILIGFLIAVKRISRQQEFKEAS